MKSVIAPIFAPLSEVEMFDEGNLGFRRTWTVLSIHRTNEPSTVENFQLSLALPWTRKAKNRLITWYPPIPLYHISFTRYRAAY